MDFYFSIMLTMVRAVLEYKDWIRLRKGVAVAKKKSANKTHNNFALFYFAIFLFETVRNEARKMCCTTITGETRKTLLSRC
jgi:hypothetical protein